MKRCDNYELNLSRLLDSCSYIQDDELYKGIYNYCIENQADLNCINFDDWVVNGITYLDNDEYEELNDEQKEDVYVVAKNNEGVWIW